MSDPPEELLHTYSSVGQEGLPTPRGALLYPWPTEATDMVATATLVDVAGGQQGAKTHLGGEERLW